MICVYRIREFVLNVMTPFYLDMGFSNAEIAEARKVFGIVMTMLGVFLGGLSVRRLGIMPSMMIGAFAGPLSHIGFIWLSTQGPQFHALLIAIGMDNIAAGFSGTCLIAYMSSLTAEGFTATQYALFSSLYALPGKLLASQTGRIIESSAHAADEGGFTAPLKALFANVPPQTFAHAMEKSHVSPAALGAGYVTFFLYSIVIGVAAIILAFILGARRAGGAGRRRARARADLGQADHLGDAQVAAQVVGDAAVVLCGDRRAGRRRRRRTCQPRPRAALRLSGAVV